MQRTRVHSHLRAVPVQAASQLLQQKPLDRVDHDRTQSSCTTYCQRGRPGSQAQPPLSALPATRMRFESTGSAPQLFQKQSRAALFEEKQRERSLKWEKEKEERARRRETTSDLEAKRLRARTSQAAAPAPKKRGITIIRHGPDYVRPPREPSPEPEPLDPRDPANFATMAALVEDEIYMEDWLRKRGKLPPRPKPREPTADEVLLGRQFDWEMDLRDGARHLSKLRNDPFVSEEVHAAESRRLVKEIGPCPARPALTPAEKQQRARQKAADEKGDPEKVIRRTKHLRKLEEQLDKAHEEQPAQQHDAYDGMSIRSRERHLRFEENRVRLQKGLALKRDLKDRVGQGDDHTTATWIIDSVQFAAVTLTAFGARYFQKLKNLCGWR